MIPRMKTAEETKAIEAAIAKTNASEAKQAKDFQLQVDQAVEIHKRKRADAALKTELARRVKQACIDSDAIADAEASSVERKKKADVNKQRMKAQAKADRKRAEAVQLAADKKHTEIMMAKDGAARVKAAKELLAKRDAAGLTAAGLPDARAITIAAARIAAEANKKAMDDAGLNMPPDATGVVDLTTDEVDASSVKTTGDPACLFPCVDCLQLLGVTLMFYVRPALPSYHHYSVHSLSTANIYLFSSLHFPSRCPLKTYHLCCHALLRSNSCLFIMLVLPVHVAVSSLSVDANKLNIHTHTHTTLKT